MTPKISLVTVVAVALVAVPAAWGVPQPNARGMLASDSVESARQAQPFNTRAVLASDSVESARAESQPVNLRDVLASDSVESAKTESQAFNLRDVLASDSVEAYSTAQTSVDRRIVGDNYREPLKPVTHPATIAASGSGNEIEWPQVGIGFGLGVLLAIGLLLAMRFTRIRQLAH